MYVKYRGYQMGEETNFSNGPKLEIAEFVGISYDYDEQAAVITLGRDYLDVYIPYVNKDKYHEIIESIEKHLGVNRNIFVIEEPVVIVDDDVFESYDSLKDYIELCIPKKDFIE